MLWLRRDAHVCLLRMNVTYRAYATHVFNVEPQRAEAGTVSAYLA
jgi:hypothetical protein